MDDFDSLVDERLQSVCVHFDQYKFENDPPMGMALISLGITITTKGWTDEQKAGIDDAFRALKARVKEKNAI